MAKLIACILLLFSLSCTDEYGSETGCLPERFVGSWDVYSLTETIFLNSDSVRTQERQYEMSLLEDGTGSLSFISDDIFQWYVQCNPDVFITANIGGEEVFNGSGFYSVFNWDVTDLFEKKIKLNREIETTRNGMPVISNSTLVLTLLN